MRRLSDSEVRERQLKLLDEFARYCDEHNLMYSLAFGTLIGAIRHKGYIPWDDDVDVWMPYPDYIKFLSGYRNNENFEVQYVGINKSYRHPFGRLVEKHSVCFYNYLGKSSGVNIDIYPICGLDKPESFIDIYNKVVSERKKYHNLLQFTKILSIFKISKLTLDLRANIIKVIEKEYAKYDYDNSEFVFPFTRGLVMEKKLFDNVDYVEFEGKKYKAFGGYDKILRMIYGNYMALPPEEDQVPHHGVIYYDNE